jgi:hypothetical protein
MIKVMAICDFSDLLNHAQEMGFDWNNAHDLLRKADIYVGTIYYGDADLETGTHIEARKILKSFMDKNDLQKFYITPKNYEA